MASLLLSLNAFAVSDMNLKVINKTCDIKSLAVTATDQYQLRSGMLVEFSQVSEDETKKCAQAVVYNKLISENGRMQDNKSVREKESGSLSAPMKRTVCRNKADNSVLSDETVKVEAEAGSISVISRQDLKTKMTDVMLVIKGSVQCPKGNLTVQAQVK